MSSIVFFFPTNRGLNPDSALTLLDVIAPKTSPIFLVPYYSSSDKFLEFCESLKRFEDRFQLCAMNREGETYESLVSRVIDSYQNTDFARFVACGSFEEVSDRVIQMHSSGTSGENFQISVPENFFCDGKPQTYYDSEELVQIKLEHNYKAQLPTDPHKVIDSLQEAISTRSAKLSEYGNTHIKHGRVMQALLGSHTASSEEGHRQLGVFEMIVSKITRLAETRKEDKFTHEDSAKDLIVYAAMLHSLIKGQSYDD